MHRVSGGSDDGKVSDDVNQAAVIAACRESVRNQLKSPKSADFGNEVATGSGGSYTVTGTVDAENSFGASIRARFSCEGTATRGYEDAVGSATIIQ